jgi:hypothetical protein
MTEKWNQRRGLSSREASSPRWLLSQLPISQEKSCTSSSALYFCLGMLFSLVLCVSIGLGFSKKWKKRMKNALSRRSEKEKGVHYGPSRPNSTRSMEGEPHLDFSGLRQLDTDDDTHSITSGTV